MSWHVRYTRAARDDRALGEIVHHVRGGRGAAAVSDQIGRPAPRPAGVERVDDGAHGGAVDLSNRRLDLPEVALDHVHSRFIGNPGTGLSLERL